MDLHDPTLASKTNEQLDDWNKGRIEVNKHKTDQKKGKRTSHQGEHAMAGQSGKLAGEGSTTVSSTNATYM